MVGHTTPNEPIANLEILNHSSLKRKRPIEGTVQEGKKILEHQKRKRKVDTAASEGPSRVAAPQSTDTQSIRVSELTEPASEADNETQAAKMERGKRKRVEQDQLKPSKLAVTDETIDKAPTKCPICFNSMNEKNSKEIEHLSCQLRFIFL